MKTNEKHIEKSQDSEKILSSVSQKIINKEDLNKNYPPNNKKREKIYTKIFIAIIYFALVICMEQLYRETLFDKSIDTQEDIREDHDKE
jgi:asparagine synthetase A